MIPANRASLADMLGMRVMAFKLVMAVVVPASAAAQLPADAGQVWKTYDISSFVERAGAGSQRHVVDWVLQETGSPQWHGTTVASLSADPSKLSCFHTPDLQVRVEEIAARFTADAATPHRFAVRVLGE